MVLKRLLKYIPLLAVLLFAGCGGSYEKSGTLIVSAREALQLAGKGSWILVDAQKASAFTQGHVKGAVNIERAQITGDVPVANCIAAPDVVAAAAADAGLTVDSGILIYDGNSNMDSGRLAWTLMVYGHKGEIRIVSGGIDALTAEGAEIVSGESAITPTVYTAGAFNASLVADKNEILELLDNPKKDTVLLDVRNDEEFALGTIPGSIHVNFERNNFRDGTYKPVQQIRILYKENGIMPEDTVIIYCQTSIRAAQTFAALYDAGYRNLKIYDGAWLEWSAAEDVPVYTVEAPAETQPVVEDAS